MKFTLLIFIFFISTACFSQKTFRYIDLNTFKWGIKDQAGKNISDPIYTDIGSLKNGRYTVRNSDFKEGIVTESGIELLKCEYSSVSDEGQDIIIVRKNGKQGILNSKLEWILPLRYNSISRQKDFYIVSDNNVSGVLDTGFKEKIPLIYSSVYHPNSLQELYFLVEKNNKRGLVDSNNKIIIPIEYDFLSYLERENRFVGGNLSAEHEVAKVFDNYGRIVFSLPNFGVNILNQSRFAVKNEKNLWGIFNEKAVQTVDFKYQKILSSGTDRYIVQDKNLKWGAIDDRGKEVIQPEYSEPFYFDGEVAFVKNNLGKYGFINKNGIKISAFTHDQIISFSNGYYLVKIDKKSGLVNKNGIEVLKTEYDFINAPEDRLVIVGKNKKQYLLNLNKASQSAVEYDYIDSIKNKDLILVQKNGLYGFINSDEKAVIPAIYENARPFMDGFASVKLNGRTLIIDKTGKTVGQ